MRLFIALLLTVSAGLTVECRSPSPNVPPVHSGDASPPSPNVKPAPDASAPSSVVRDATAPKTLEQECREVYDRTAAMGCPPYGNRDKSWAPACANAERNGIDFHLKCFETARDCAAVRECE
jgi:hypothetical protein